MNAESVDTEGRLYFVTTLITIEQCQEYCWKESLKENYPIIIPSRFGEHDFQPAWGPSLPDRAEGGGGTLTLRSLNLTV